MATLFLIRHAEPEHLGVFLGQEDSPLSTAGHAQAKAAMASLEVAAAYSSPLRRALQTAEYIRGSALIQEPDLRELHQGAWTGLTWTEIESRWPDLALQKSADWLGIPAPGGETWQALRDRVARAWHKIRLGPEPCAVVGHQAVNAALAHIICERDPLQFTQQYAEVIRIEYA